MSVEDQFANNLHKQVMLTRNLTDTRHRGSSYTCDRKTYTYLVYDEKTKLTENDYERDQQ
jgi:hypothetical protein